VSDVSVYLDVEVVVLKTLFFFGLPVEGSVFLDYLYEVFGGLVTRVARLVVAFLERVEEVFETVVVGYLCGSVGERSAEFDRFVYLAGVGYVLADELRDLVRHDGGE
jgi:hypothetical protein